MHMFLNQQQVEKIVILEKQVKDAQIASEASSFSNLTLEEFKKVLCKVHQEFCQFMVNLYTCFDEMQGLYNSFRQHSKTLKTIHDQRKSTSRAFEHVIDWKMHISDRPHDMPNLDNQQAKTTEVTIETWDNISDSVEAIIREGQSISERRWETSKVFLGYLDLPILYPIAQVHSPKLQLE